MTNHLFQEPANDYGKDLASINIQRAREHGIPGYPSWRQHCKLPPIKSWSSMLTDISNATVKAYYDMYTSPEDVDLWSAGVSERSVDDSVVGPTFNCIIAKTFSDLKKGDRFWYENPGLPNSFSLGNFPFARAFSPDESAPPARALRARRFEFPSVRRRTTCRYRDLKCLDSWP